MLTIKANLRWSRMTFSKYKNCVRTQYLPCETFLFYSFIHFFISFIYYLFMVCLQLCREHGFIVWFQYVLRSSMDKLVKWSIFIHLVPALLWLSSFGVGKQLVPSPLPVTPQPLLSKQSPFHMDYLSWDVGSNFTHQMSVSVNLWVSRLGGRDR